MSLIGVATATPHSFALHMEQGFCVNPGNPVQVTWVTRAFTADDNHVASVTDAGGNVVKYTWDEVCNLMKSMTDARGNILSDIYDEADCLKSVSMKVGEGGGSQTVENTGLLYGR